MVLESCCVETSKTTTLLIILLRFTTIFFIYYNLRINLDNTDLIFFDSSNIAHSNPPIKLLKNNVEYETYDNSNIVSLVFFKSKCLLIK